MTSIGKYVLVLFALTLLLALGADLVSAQERAAAKTVKLPAYEKGKVRTYEPGHAFKQPYAIKCVGNRAGNPLGHVDTTAEYDIQEGVIFAWGQGWNSLVREMTLHAADAANNSKVFMLCDNASQQASCYTNLENAGVDMNQVEFIIHNMDAVWCRDYGPHFIFNEGVRAVVNSQYYSTRANDNAAPVSVADQLNMALYDIPLMYSGGNYQASSNNHAYMSDLIQDDNPGVSVAELGQIFADYQGVDTLHIFPAFPSSIDGTGHIDMWMCVLSDDKVVIGEYPEISPTYQAYVITENAVTYMQNLGFTVYRVPNYNSGSGGYNGTHFTYTNAFMLNNKMFIICYGAGHEAEDREAELTFTAALPGYEIIPINCLQIIPYAGAMHCICMQVPAYTDSDPSVQLLEPVGGEIWSSDSERKIRWDADDDDEVTSVDLYLSMDGGVTYPYVLATGEEDDGLFEGYDVPYLKDDECRVKAVAHDADTNQGEDESTDFTMKKLFTKVYDFSRGDIGVDRYAYGTLTTAWSNLNGYQFPAAVNTPIDQVEATAYEDLAYSDATGAGTSNRYMNPNGTKNQESTLIVHFKITELPKRVHSLEVLWEGYAQKTQEMELYIWDYTAGNWGDGKGNSGQDAFIGCVANKNTDRVIETGIYENVDRYIGPDGLVSLLVYVDPTWYQQAGLDTYHDYISLTVQSLPARGELTPIE